MKPQTFVTPRCCDRPSIATMDYKKHSPDNWRECESMVNRVCLRCNAHWAGEVNNVHQYTGREWDALINDAFSLEKI